jgi:hypothetical protein
VKQRGHAEAAIKRTGMGLLLVLSVGCATTEPRVIYEKAGTPEAQVKKDHAACVRASVTGEETIVSNILKLDREAYKRCMEGRGYTVRL